MFLPLYRIAYLAFSVIISIREYQITGDFFRAMTFLIYAPFLEGLYWLTKWNTAQRKKFLDDALAEMIRNRDKVKPLFGGKIDQNPPRRKSQ